MPVRRLLPFGLVCLLAGCGSIGAIGLGPMNSNQNQQQMGGLPPPSPNGPVASAPLPPPNGTEPLPDPGAGGQQANANPPPTTGGSLSRTDLLGGWTISSSGDSCQLFMTLTSWTGGYRASTRGCSNDALKSISAWNLDGKQVVLAGTGGTPVAHLSSAGGTRFDGQTVAGGQVSFYR